MGRSAARSGKGSARRRSRTGSRKDRFLEIDLTKSTNAINAALAGLSEAQQRRVLVAIQKGIEEGGDKIADNALERAHSDLSKRATDTAAMMLGLVINGNPRSAFFALWMVLGQLGLTVDERRIYKTLEKEEGEATAQQFRSFASEYRASIGEQSTSRPGRKTR